MNQKHLAIGVVSLLIVALLVSTALHFYDPSNSPPLVADPNAVNWEGRQLLQQAFNGTDGIAIPGYDLQYFAADQTLQKVNFYNPSSNDCFFKISLIVDGTNLWESGNIAPGDGYYEVELSDPLPEGEYAANLKIECFTMEGKPLNGATVEFQIIAQ